MNETVETNVIKEPSRIIPKRLDARTMAVKSTGEVIRVTNDHRVIYAHLEDQFRGLTNPKNIAAGRSTGHFYDSDENLAIKNDVSKSTFKKVKRDLKALGLIDWKTPKAKKSGHACEYFVKQLIDIAHNLDFIYQELPNGQPSYDHERVSSMKSKKTKKAAQPKIEESESGAQEQQQEQQSATDGPKTAASDAGVGQPIPSVDAGDDADLSGSNHSVMNDQPEKGSNDNARPAWFRAPFKGNGDLIPEAKAWARLQGATSEEDEKSEIRRMLNILKPILDFQSEPEPSEPPLVFDEPESTVEDFDDTIPF